MRALLLIAALAGCRGEDCDEPGTICTVIGAPYDRDAWHYDGDPRDPLDVELASPSDLAVDPTTGTLYVIDFNAFVVRALGGDGLVRVVAGTGELGPLHDGPAA